MSERESLFSLVRLRGQYDFDEWTAEKTPTLSWDEVEALIEVVEAADEIITATKNGDLTPDEAEVAWKKSRDSRLG